MKLPTNTFSLLIFGLIALGLISCDSESTSDKLAAQDIFIIGNSAEPKGIDPHTVTGAIEGDVIRALLEGLCLEHPSIDGKSEPGAAASWESNNDSTEWTFHLQPEGKWSDGTPLTTEDFLFSYHRILNPKFRARYASMLYFIKNAQDYNSNQRAKIIARHHPELHWEQVSKVNLRGEPTKRYKDELSKLIFNDLQASEDQLEYLVSLGLDKANKEQLQLIKGGSLSFPFPESLTSDQKDTLLDLLIDYNDKDLWDIAQVGLQAKDKLTLSISLHSPLPFLPDITKHYTWFPVPKHIVLKYGSLDDPNQRQWTNPEHMVGNGPFALQDWKFNHMIKVKKNPHYWDADEVKLNGIEFLPIANTYTETRMFLADQLHRTAQIPSEMVEHVKTNRPHNTRQDTYLSCSFLRFNVTHPELANKDLRAALSYSVDAQLIIDNILKGGEALASGIVPPMGEYSPAGHTQFNLELAKTHLQAYEKQSGKNASGISIVLLTNNKDSSKIQAEALQDMWKKHLGIDIKITQSEWATYLDAMSNLDYGICTGGWIGDYSDPTTFLDLWKAGDGNNRTGWENSDYEEILKKAALTVDPSKRVSLLKQAELLFLNDYAIRPICWKSKNYLLDERVKGYHPLLLNSHPYKYIYFEK